MALAQGHICQCLSRILKLRRRFPFTICGNRRKSGDQFVNGVLSLARGLLDLGVERGHVVAIAALNSEWYLEWLLAITYVGAIAAPLNYRWSFEEARSAMELVGPVMLVVDDESFKLWSLKLQHHKLSATLKTCVFLGDPSLGLGTTKFLVTTSESIRKPSEGPLTFDFLQAPEEIALICFTSGTTGRPKGVAISHTALIVQSLAKIAVVGYGEDDVYLHTAPLCHIGGISSGIAMLMVGACHVLIPKFEPKSVFEAIKQHRVTSLITVPTMMADMISFLRKQGTWRGGESVTKVLNGGGGLSNDLLKGATRIFPNARLLSAYGMTEACSSLTFVTLTDPSRQNSGNFYWKNTTVDSKSINQLGGVRVGKPAPHVEIQITGGNPNDTPTAGRILTRGPHVMVRYWDRIPAMLSDSGEIGWLDTGDIGWIDEYGDLWLIGRKKDRIKSGGENIYPQEVEAVISQHPGVSGVVVAGIPNARLSEMVVACVQLRENWQWFDLDQSHEGKDQILSEKILHSYCKERNLTGFKIPKIFILWTKPFPLTSTGKPRRDEVRREAMSHVQLMRSSL
ncbi:acyl-activating enzyme 14 [Tasmannia lanceolata]|uniref:acyl-activating enzyme 14 n=1 Tax=Tasmannia lanceolata TaxID=3420 RepID=UPI004064B95F